MADPLGNGYTTFIGELRPCWHCHWWGGFAPGGVHGRCARPGGTPVQATPRGGCAFWLRESGADDEAGPPQAAG